MPNALPSDVVVGYNSRRRKMPTEEELNEILIEKPSSVLAKRRISSIDDDGVAG